MKSILFSYFPTFVYFNHGAALLTAICKREGIDADYFPLIPEWYELMKDYDIIGFSYVTDADYIASIPFVMAANYEGKTVIAGGVYARRGAYIHSDLFDYICRGEGEDIVSFIKDGDTKIFESKRECDDLDTLPMPDLSHVSGYEFHRGFPFLHGKKIMPYQTSRGCPFGCTFCDVAYQGSKIRIKHTIKEDLEKIQRTYRPDLVYMMDTNPPYWLKEWREQFKDLYVPFQSFIRADISQYELEFMIAHGLKFTLFGVESGSEKYRNEVLKKGITDEQIRKTVGILKENEVVYAPFYMAGMPGETEEDVEATKNMIKELGGWAVVWKYQDLGLSVVKERGKKIKIVN